MGQALPSDPLEEYRVAIHAQVRPHLPEGGAPPPLEQPPEGLGDFALPCFALAKAARKSPQAIAAELAGRLSPSELFSKIEASGAYVNFAAEPGRLAARTLNTILERREVYGTLPQRKERVLLEHTSINPTGPIHVGRARNPIIGDTLARLLRRAGFEVTTEFYVNDVGRQVVTMAWGVTHLSDGPSSEERGKADHRLVSKYQEASRLAEERPEVLAEIDQLLSKLEHGEPETSALVRETSERVLEAMLQTLERIGVRFDRFTFESRFLEDGSVSKIMEELRRLPQAGEAEGAYHLELRDFGIAGRDTRFVFQRADGTSLYTTRDLAYHRDKFARCDRAINILGEDQRLGQQQLAAALHLTGEPRTPEVLYYAFVSLPEGRMSTRKGRVVYMDDLIDEAVELAMAEVRKRRADELSEEQMAKIAEAVGCGALRYNIVRVQPEKQIVFRWEEALSFEGNSAPFVMYAHARACSILRKAGSYERQFDWSLLTEPQERALIRQLARFPSVIRDAAERRRPHQLVVSAQETAILFNQFYQFVPVLAGGERRVPRLALVEASRWVLRNTLETLGITPLEEM